MSQRLTLKRAIGIVVDVLKLFSIPSPTPEQFRQAKFDQESALAPLWTLLHNIVLYLEAARLGINYEPVDRNTTHADKLFTLSCLYRYRYPCLEMYQLEYQSSRALLIAATWLLRNTELLRPEACQQEILANYQHLLSALSSRDTTSSNAALIETMRVLKQRVRGRPDVTPIPTQEGKTVVLSRHCVAVHHQLQQRINALQQHLQQLEAYHQRTAELTDHLPVTVGLQGLHLLKDKPSLKDVMKELKDLEGKLQQTLQAGALSEAMMYRWVASMLDEDCSVDPTPQLLELCRKAADMV
eukprot:TRINITY_DN5617_c0_g1_i1.p1 TRINITY_DN5617_c0_g1~~TRINITY_DN5617_c0_g1_i1.p1  ORF type:complete len:298 (+),score=77.74 TRINITY_DN5617_c0_g1_i1:121-1014(+)